jgi:hypothetical protein
MKSLIRIIFKPVFNRLESHAGDYVYKTSHRVILIVVSLMFMGLAATTFVLSPGLDYLFPVVVFGGAGVLGLAIGSAGTDAAVAKLWDSRPDV